MSAIKPSLIQFLSSIASDLAQSNCQSYIVGGFVRDWLLDRETSDIDIIVNVDATEIAKNISQSTGGKYVLLDENNSIARVIVADEKQSLYLDFAMFRDSIKDDLARRDFTVNAMAFELCEFVSGSPCLIDPFQGKKDLKKKLIRTVSSVVFKDDAVRLLRAVRLAAELGFRIEYATEQLIKQHAQLVSTVSGERQREEFLRMLAVPCAGDLLRYLDRLHLLMGMMPELEKMRGVEQPKEHYWDVLNHSLETVATVEFLLRERNWEHGSNELLKMTPWSDEMKEHFDEKITGSSNRRVMLKLGGLLHDIAKPQTKTLDTTGRMRFIGHTKQGAIEAVDILKKLRFSSREIKLVKNLVYYHLRPAQMANTGLPTSRAIYRYFRDTGDDGIDILLLALADYLAARGPKLDSKEWEQHNRLTDYMIAENQKQQSEFLSVKLIDGHDLIDIFGLTSGPLIGKLLRLVSEMQASGEVSTRDEALSLVNRELSK